MNEIICVNQCQLESGRLIKRHTDQINKFNVSKAVVDSNQQKSESTRKNIIVVKKVNRKKDVNTSPVVVLRRSERTAERKKRNCDTNSVN